MRRLQSVVSRIWEKFLISLGVLCVLLPISPLNMPSTGRDSGVFLYMGWRILHGELPYRDIWDHKPPVVFYINALGLAIVNHSRWGIWFIEFVSLLTAAIIGYYLIKKAFGTLSAVLSTLFWLLTLVFVIEGGNLTTEYTLPLQFAALWLIYDVDKPEFPNWRYFLIGFMGAITFFTKQTAIGIWIAIILYLTCRRLSSGQVRRWLRELFLVFTGSMVPVAAILIFFGVQGVLPQLWSAAFKYNVVYSSSTTDLMSRLEPLYYGIMPLTTVGLFQFSMVGCVFAIILVLFKKDVLGHCLSLVTIGLFDLLIELFLVSTSGYVYSHYYMAMLPVLSLFTGMLFWVFSSQITAWEIPVMAKYAFVIGVTLITMWGSFQRYSDQVEAFREKRNDVAIRFIGEATSPDDYVLIWGAETSANYFSHRRSPSRFVYQYPLYQAGYVDEKMIEEFLGDIVQKHPRLIIDTHNPTTPIYNFPIHSQAIDARIGYLQSHYQKVKVIDFWTIYKYRGANP